jgi:hypothetical protein
MASGEEFDSIYGETIDQAIKTGFLFSRSLNHYENHTRDELLKQGYSEEIIECAERVLAHFGTSLGSKGGKIPEELWSIRPCADCRTPVDSRIFSDGMWRYGVELCEQCFDKREAKKQCLHCKSKYDDPAVEDDFLGRCKERYVPREKTSEEKETPQCFEEDNDYFTPLRTKGLQKKSEKRKIELRYVCSWCALTEYCIKDYIRNRIEDYGSESTKDSAKLRIKPEKFERYREGKKGEDAGKKWKDYYVEYDSYLYAKFKNPISVEEIRVVP